MDEQWQIEIEKVESRGRIVSYSRIGSYGRIEINISKYRKKPGKQAPRGQLIRYKKPRQLAG